MAQKGLLELCTQGAGVPCLSQSPALLTMETDFLDTGSSCCAEQHQPLLALPELEALSWHLSAALLGDGLQS